MIIILIAPGWPNMPCFWDLVAMSSQIPLSLPNLPKLLAQLFNQIPHRNLTNLNLHAWLQEPQQSRSRASLRQWQQELRLLKEDQPDQSIKWCITNQVDFRAPSVSSVADFLMYLFQDRKLQPGTIDHYRSTIADKLGNSPFNISKDENLTRLLDSFHRDRPKVRTGIPSWNLSLVLHQLTKAPFEPIKEVSMKHLTSRQFSSWLLGRVNVEVRYMLGKTEILDTSPTGQRCPCTHYPAFFPRISWPMRVQTVWAQWLYQPSPQLWIGLSSLTGPSVWSEHCNTIWIRISDIRQNKGFCLL